ncbi:hypothetical protein [Cellulomonas cellasea]|uniref:Uncharacterized protein n=1 Tax=Cellulomonas cellasea TaxID=43670 RepID=A0A7W4UH71_9CELL|nr:hypothetical protein [Cellulomonas cellasea]MBB2924092.1 hypothetical protein [Cellulomonas cellasea]
MKPRTCERCGGPIEQTRGRPRLMHVDCRAAQRREYFADRPSRRRSTEDRLRPALLPLVQKLATARGRAELQELTSWAERTLRAELSQNLSGQTRLEHQRRLDVVVLLAQTMEHAARTPGLQKASTRQLDRG